MKFQLIMNDADGVRDAATKAALVSLTPKEKALPHPQMVTLLEQREDALDLLLGDWLEFREGITIDVDTEARTLKIVPRKLGSMHDPYEEIARLRDMIVGLGLDPDAGVKQPPWANRPPTI